MFGINSGQKQGPSSSLSLRLPCFWNSHHSLTRRPSPAQPGSARLSPARPGLPRESPDPLSDRRAPWPQTGAHYTSSADHRKQENRNCCFTPFLQTLNRLPLPNQVTPSLKTSQRVLKAALVSCDGCFQNTQTCCWDSFYILETSAALLLLLCDKLHPKYIHEGLCSSST